jgi:hypothetical protein
MLISTYELKIFREGCTTGVGALAVMGGASPHPSSSFLTGSGILYPGDRPNAALWN